METRVTYTAAASSMDSWDMDNLKYLKNMSKNEGPESQVRPHGKGQPLLSNRRRLPTGSVSYKSGSDLNGEEEFMKEVLDLDLDIPSEGNNGSPGVGACGIDRSLTTGEENDNLGSLAPLDTCYLLDVVTIRNESVLAVRHPKQMLGSDGSSSAGSSIEEGNFFDDVHEPMPDIQTAAHLNRAQSRTTSNSTLIEQSRRNGFKSPCPYCCDRGNEFYYLGQKGSFEDSSLVPTVGGECPPELPRTPSPYYVRLRRDLISYTPSLRQPRNFGMDKQGQLLIDYSPNWDGLEKYVRNLKRC